MKKILVTKYTALVDDEDYQNLSLIKWYPHHQETRIYAISKQGYMHRLLMNAHKGQMIDHINGNCLDNRKLNLRFCNFQGNRANAVVSKNNALNIKGVKKSKNKYKARITINNKTIDLGSFQNLKDASKAYDEAAIKYFGKFAKTNEQFSLY
jgi:hypothetical protein